MVSHTQLRKVVQVFFFGLCRVCSNKRPFCLSVSNRVSPQRKPMVVHATENKTLTSNRKYRTLMRFNDVFLYKKCHRLKLYVFKHAILEMNLVVLFVTLVAFATSSLKSSISAQNPTMVSHATGKILSSCEFA